MSYILEPERYPRSERFGCTEADYYFTFDKTQDGKILPYTFSVACSKCEVLARIPKSREITPEGLVEEMRIFRENH
jgi:hypothetical protein